MTAAIDLTDVEIVSEFELALPMKLLVDAERSMCLMRGASVEDKRAVETAFWNSYKGPTRRGVSILIRFWCLVEAFTAKRFKALLLGKGFQLIGPAVAAASGMRLNAHWGYNPQRLLWGIEAASKVASNVGARSHGARLGVVHSGVAYDPTSLEAA